MAIFRKEGRMPVPLQEIGDETVRTIYGDDAWGGNTYYADYAGLARALAPAKILELGVFLGYSAVAMMAGSFAVRDRWPTYVGIDAQIERAGSNAIALANIRQLCPQAKVDIFTEHLDHDSAVLPADAATLGPFDLANVDADHTPEGTFATLVMAWENLSWDGVLVLDDYRDPQVRAGAQLFFLRHLAKKQATALVQWYDDNPRGWLLLQKEA